MTKHYTDRASLGLLSCRLKLIIVVMIAFSPLGLAGCVRAILAPVAALSCLDALIPRSSSETKTMNVIFTNRTTGVSVDQRIVCEEYYNAQCSVRGNYWDWRNREKIESVTFKTSDGKTLKLVAPTCDHVMYWRSVPGYSFVPRVQVTWGGGLHSYWLSKEGGRMCYGYEKGVFGRHCTRDQITMDISVEYGN